MESKTPVKDAGGSQTAGIWKPAPHFTGGWWNSMSHTALTNLMETHGETFHKDTLPLPAAGIEPKSGPLFLLAPWLILYGNQSDVFQLLSSKTTPVHDHTSAKRVNC